MSATKSMLYYAFAIVVLRGASFVMLPIVTSHVEVEQYGILNILSSFTAIASMVLTLGLGEAVYRFASTGKERHQQRVFSWCFTVSVLGCGLFSLTLVIFADRFNSLFPLTVHEHQFRLVVVNLGFAAISTVPYAIWRMTGRAKHFAAYASIHTLIQSALTVLLLQYGFGIDANLIAGATSSVLCGSWLLWKFKSLVSFKYFARTSVRWQYALSMMLSAATMYFLQGAEQWVIAANVGAAALASYFIAAQLGLAVALMIEPFKMWWFARRHRSIQDPSINNPLFSVFGTELAGLAALVVMAGVPLLLPLLVPESYLTALIWLPWVCLITVLRQQSELMNLGCYVKWDGKAPLFINLCAATVMLSLALLLVDGFGLAGVLVAMLVANLIRTLLSLFISQYLMRQAYAMGRVILMWTWLLLAFALSDSGNSLWVFGLVAIHSSIITISYHSLWLPKVNELMQRKSSGSREVLNG